MDFLRGRNCQGGKLTYQFNKNRHSKIWGLRVEGLMGIGDSVYFVIAQWFSPVDGFVSLQAFAFRLAFSR
jgi:hypothetical protein